MRFTLLNNIYSTEPAPGSGHVVGQPGIAARTRFTSDNQLEKTMSRSATTASGELSGKNVFITGAAQGIGAAIAQRMSEAGATVIIGDLNLDQAERTAKSLTASTGNKVGAVPLNVADTASVQTTAQTVREAYGEVDVVVNNAGISNDAAAVEHTDADWDRVIAVNLTGAFKVSREFGKYFPDHGGAVVNISSIAALLAGRPERHVAYDVSKAGIIALTRTLAVEWASRGVRVNAVAPGYTETEILLAVGASNPAVLEEWLSQIPQRRLIQPREIADVVTYLASDTSSAITGQLVVADGGYTSAA
ncbi:SDR family NAD(P)-dependent oxidoreductase [Streptomyces asiaticus]